MTEADVQWYPTVNLPGLPLTKTHGLPGEAGLMDWPGVGPRPACSRHGAMLRVSPDRDWWRCSTCNIGGDWDRGADLAQEAKGSRSVAEILAHADELAQRFENDDLGPGTTLDGAPLREVRRAFEDLARANECLAKAVTVARRSGHSSAMIRAMLSYQKR